jgi:hypothetical protein
MDPRRVGNAPVFYKTCGSASIAARDRYVLIAWNCSYPSRRLPLKYGDAAAQTEEQLTVMRGGLTAEEYRWKLIKKTPGS